MTWCLYVTRKTRLGLNPTCGVNACVFLHFRALKGCLRGNNLMEKVVIVNDDDG